MGEGLAGQRRLIDRHVDRLGETTVGGDDVSDFERNHVSGNQVCRFDFTPSSGAPDLGLGRKRVHEGLDSVSGAPFLVETNGRVGKQEQDDTNEIFPVGWASSTVRESDGDEGGSLHDPRERVPHERQELRA